jgi:uncharacterized protein YktA (UPF0223 family)
MPAFLRAETLPLAAISVLPVYAIFYRMPVGTMEHGHRAKRFKNIVSASPSTTEQHAAPTVFAVTASLVSCYGNYRDICPSKKKVKKELNAYRRFEYSSDQGEQNI